MYHPKQHVYREFPIVSRGRCSVDKLYVFVKLSMWYLYYYLARGVIELAPSLVFPHTEETVRMEITPCVSHALRLHPMYSIISRR